MQGVKSRGEMREYKSNKELKPEDQMITADPDIEKIKNENIDYIIMGCDGIW